MKNKLLVIFTVSIISALVFSGCGKKQTQEISTEQVKEPEIQITTTTKTDILAEDTALSNPATVYCLQSGGKFNMQKSLDGTAEGFCVLPNNITCEVWEYYKGECPTNKLNKEVVNDEEIEISEEGDEKKIPEKIDEDERDEITNKEEDEQLNSNNNDDRNIVELPEVSEKTRSSTENIDAQGLVLSAEPGEDPGEIVNSWQMNGLKAPNGFYIMLSGSSDITYPTKYFHELNNSMSRSFVWTGLTKDKMYYFRVCIIESDGCGEYSQIASGKAE